MKDLNCFTHQELRLLLSVIRQCYQCRTEQDVKALFDRLKGLIPFEDWAIAIFYFNQKRELFFDNYVWFRQIPGYEAYYFKNELYRTDPIFQLFQDRITTDQQPTVQFWRESWQACDPDFMKQSNNFGLFHGYSHVHQLNGVSGLCLSFTGPEMSEKSSRIVLLMELLTPHVMPLLLYAKTGKSSRLATKEFLSWQLLRTSMSASMIARLLNVSESAIDKTCRAIRKKTGDESRTKMIIGLSAPSVERLKRKLHNKKAND